MEKHPEKLSQGVTRRDGSVTPFNASDAVAAVVDVYGHPIPSSWRARLGKAAKSLLEDGFDPNTVCAAMYAAVRRARPDLVITNAMELQNARFGLRIATREWQRSLYRTEEESAPERSRVYAYLREVGFK